MLRSLSTFKIETKNFFLISLHSKITNSIKNILDLFNPLRASVALI